MAHLPHSLIWLIPLRSLNSCCHYLRQTLLLNCWGSRSPAWILRFVRLLWGVWLNGCQQVGHIGQAQWDLAGRDHYIPKPRHVGPPQSNQNDSLAWGVLQLLHHFAQYGWWWEGVCFQILPWLTERIHCCGQGIRYRWHRGNLFLNLVANKSILGQCHLLHRVEKPLEGETTVWMVWPSLDSLSATTFGRPGMCRALESLVSWYPGQDSP